MGSEDSQAFKPAEAEYALAKAYIPEQIPGLMRAISRATPFLMEDYLGFVKDNWVILVGYPLEGKFDADRCATIFEQVKAAYHPEYLWFIGPEIPPALAKSCRSRQSDQYYDLDLSSFEIKSSLRRQVRRAAEKLTIEQTRNFEPDHQSLVNELMARQKPPAMISELYRSMPDYISLCETSRMLNARDSRGKLTAFFVVETGAVRFDTYILGCHSKTHYVAHASDLLFSEMIRLTRQRDKSWISLGLGVNRGIRRFKMKWGGLPSVKYEFCETYYGPPEQVSIVDLLMDKF